MKRQLGRNVLLLGLAGTRWLFACGLLSAGLVWLAEAQMGVLSPVDWIGYPLLLGGFALLLVLLWRAPRLLPWWQRLGTTLVALYFTLLMFALTLQDDPGPAIYTLSTVGMWFLGGLLLLFTTWPARKAAGIALTFMVLMLLPAALRRFGPEPPQWLVTHWPFLLNMALAVAMYTLVLWGLARLLAHLLVLAPASSEQITTAEVAQARVAELERSREQIESASRAKSEFLAALGHEIRTPMNTVLGMTQLVLAEPLPEEQRNRLKQAQRAGEGLLRMIDSLLDFATLDAGRLQLQLGPLRVEAVMDEALNTVRAAAQAKQIELLCEFASPELLGDEGWRRGDPRRIAQVLGELLSNAVKFTAKGQVRLRAALKHDSTASWLVLQVRDSGIGIPPEQLSHLFTPFLQAEGGMTRRFGGTGLGLAIADRLTQLMDGKLSARSTLGRGSEFELRLPLPRCAPALTDRPLPAQRVLLVQAAHTAGHNSLREQMQRLAPGAQVEVVSQGSDALVHLGDSRQPLDLLLVDWVLPDMDGSQLLQKLNAQQGAIPARRVVLLSAFDTPALRERAAKLGAQLLAPKPLMPPLLRRLLDPKASLPEMKIMPAPGGPVTTDRAALVTEFDQLLGNADSRALTLWESYESELMDMLPAQHVKALAGAMERLDFDSAQAALRHAQPHNDSQEP